MQITTTSEIQFLKLMLTLGYNNFDIKVTTDLHGIESHTIVAINNRIVAESKYQ